MNEIRDIALAFLDPVLIQTTLSCMNQVKTRTKHVDAALSKRDPPQFEADSLDISGQAP